MCNYILITTPIRDSRWKTYLTPLTVKGINQQVAVGAGCWLLVRITHQSLFWTPDTKTDTVLSDHTNQEKAIQFVYVLKGVWWWLAVKLPSQIYDSSVFSTEKCELDGLIAAVCSASSISSSAPPLTALNFLRWLSLWSLMDLVSFSCTFVPQRVWSFLMEMVSFPNDAALLLSVCSAE